VLDKLDMTKFRGPFRRCIDIVVPEWQVIVDVPDITFRVTQDTNGDGTEETIYAEGFFDVRWNAGATRIASQPILSGFSLAIGAAASAASATGGERSAMMP
jgi:hypothetical protein